MSSGLGDVTGRLSVNTYTGHSRSQPPSRRLPPYESVHGINTAYIQIIRYIINYHVTFIKVEYTYCIIVRVADLVAEITRVSLRIGCAASQL